MKILKILLLIIIFLAIGVGITIIFIEEKIQLTKEEERVCNSEAARTLASIHFDHPLQRLMTLKQVITGRDGGRLDVSGYTIFGIELTRAKIPCGELSSIITVKQFGI